MVLAAFSCFADLGLYKDVLKFDSHMLGELPNPMQFQRFANEGCVFVVIWSSKLCVFAGYEML